MAINAETALLRLAVDTGAATQALAEFQGKIGQLSSSITAQAKSFENLTAAAKQTFDILTAGVRSYAALASEGDRVGDIMAALTVDTRQASDAIGGTISNTNLAIAANRAHQAGLELTDQQFRAVVVAAKQFADATREDATAATDRLVQAVVRGSERGLRPFGIDATDSATAIAELSRKFGDASIAVDGLGDNLEAASGAWDNLHDAIAKSINDRSSGLGGVVGLFSDLANAIARSESASRALGDVVTSVLLGPLGQLYTSVQNLVDAINRLRLSEEDIRMLAEAGAGTDVTWGVPERTGYEAVIGEAVIEEPTPRRGGGGGGGRRREDPIWQRLQREQQVAEQIANLDRQTEEARAAIAATASERIMAESQRRIAIIREEGRERAAAIKAEMANERERARLDAENTRMAVERRQQEFLQWSGLTAAIIQNTTASIIQGATAGQVAQSMLAAILNYIAQVATAKAVMATAEGLMAAASLNWGSAAGFFASAALWATLAVGAGVAGAAVAPDLSQPGSGRGGAKAAAADRGRMLPSGGGESVVNVTVYLDAAGGVVQDSQLRRLGTVVREAQRRGYIGGSR